MKTLLASAAILAVTATASVAGGWGGGHHWGGEDGSTGAGFEFDLNATNGAAADGDMTAAMSELQKYEMGEAGSIQQTDGPDEAFAIAAVGVQGLGAAAALSAGPGSSLAQTAIVADGSGNVFTFAFED